MSFGQSFQITPIQLATSVSTYINGGRRITPHLGMQVVNAEGETIHEFSYQEKNVLSKETSETMTMLFESGVSEGTGKNAQVAGYSIGGKTGTSEDGVNTGKYVTSFIGVANTDNPELTILITLYNPTGEGGHQGGSVAAPVAGNILKEVLPYLDLKKDEEEKNEVVMQNVIGLTLKEAKEILKDFEIEIIGENLEKDSKIYKQIPEEGVKVNLGSKVILYAQ
jgi:stage V sporulation protein D (sporulation-specific penicillin-binding protein)